MKHPNSGGYLLQNWVIECNDKNNNGKTENSMKSTKTSSPTQDSGATTMPPIGNSFMYLETNGNNHEDNVFVSWERTDFIQNTNITFYYNRFSFLTSLDHKAMGCFRIHLLLEDNTWTTQYTIAKNTHYSDTSSDWTLTNLNFTVENFGNKLNYDQIGDSSLADMSFSDIMITHSVY